MNPREEKIYWNEFKNLLIKKYPQLTESELQYNECLEECMLQIIDYNIRKERQEMLDKIEDYEQMLHL